MQYTKPMIDLVYEIRRRVDSDLKPSVKMANPEMLSELVDYYFRTKDTIAKTLIKELLYMAGPQWQQLIEPEKAEEVHDIPKQVVKVYRGQTILADAAAPAAPKPIRMYRGHPVL